MPIVSRFLGGIAVAVGTIALFSPPAGASNNVKECIEDCRQQRDADRAACGELRGPKESSGEGLDEAWPALVPVDASSFRTQMSQTAQAGNPPTSPEYRECINRANRAFSACARDCTPPSPSEPPSS